VQEEKRVLGGRIELFDHEKRRSTDDIAKLAAKFDELQRDNGTLEKDFARLSETARNLVSQCSCGTSASEI
jgi:predicted phage gp36 major capsid-like protein